MNDVYLDPKELYGEQLQPYTDFWDYDLSWYQNAYNICRQAVIVPNGSILMPIAVTYTLIPSKWSKVLPILFSWGQMGTGKTTFAKFASKLHDVKLSTPNSTFASLRNNLDAMRWVDPEFKRFEKEGAILAWDNLHARTLTEDPKLYQMLLCGYDRASEVIEIASIDGANKKYYVFCPKILSSIDSIHADPAFLELHRRLIVIKHKKYESFLAHEKEEFDDEFNIAIDRLELDSISWEGLNDEYLEFWNDPAKCREYVSYRSKLTRKGKKAFVLPKQITGAQWTISIDLICTGLCVGTWESVQDAVDAIAKYWTWHQQNVEDSQFNTMRLLKEFIEEETAHQRKQNQVLGEDAEPLRISAEKLKKRLDFLNAEGALDVTAKVTVVSGLMAQLGWKLNGRDWKEIV